MDEFSVKSKRKVYYTSAVPSSVKDKQIVWDIRSTSSILEVTIGKKLCKLRKQVSA